MTFWTDSRDVLVTVALLYCTRALHKISSNEITKEEVAAQKKKKKKVPFCSYGTAFISSECRTTSFTRVSYTRLDYFSGTNCFI